MLALSDVQAVYLAACLVYGVPQLRALALSLLEALLGCLYLGFQSLLLLLQLFKSLKSCLALLLKSLLRLLGAVDVLLGCLHCLVAVLYIVLENGDSRLHLGSGLLLLQHLAAKLVSAHGALLHLPYAVGYLLLLALYVVLNVLVFILADEYLAFKLVKLNLHLVKSADPDGYLQTLALLRQLDELLRLLGLYPQRLYSALQLGEYVSEPEQVLLCGGELSLRFQLLVAEFGYSCRLLEDVAALGALGAYYLGDTSLSDYGVAVTSQTCVHEQLVDVLQSAGLAVDEVLALAAPVQLTGYADLVPHVGKGLVGVVYIQRNLRKAHRLPCHGTRKDYVLHLVSSEGLGGLLTQYPAHRVADIALAASVRSHDCGKSLVKGKAYLVGK